MKSVLYEKYYKLGFDYYINKKVLGLHKPDKAIKRFYYSLIVIMMAIGLIIS